MNIKSVKPFKAVVNFGLEYGYTQKPIDKELVIKEISNYQKTLIEKKDVYLSCSIMDSVILLNEQKEEHIKIEFINYPKFPIKKAELKGYIENLVFELMKKFNQNRVVIEYLDETKMIEIDENIDLRI